MVKKNLSLIFLLSVIVVLAWGESIPAAIYLASSPAKFQEHLTAAQATPDDDTILLAQGVYDLSSGKLTYEVTGGGALTIMPDPDFTNTGDVILDGGSEGIMPLPEGGVASRILEITNTGGTNEIITIIGITFQNAIGTALKASAPEIKIDNCKFIDNAPDYLSQPTRLGGGAELTGMVTLKNNLFDNNIGSPDMCGGVTISSGPVLLESNIFVGNSGGGVQVYGGGACITTPAFVNTEITLTNNVFDANTCSSFYGCPGGLYVSQRYGGESTVTVTNNTFVDNRALQAGSTAGAVIVMSGGFINIYNNIFWDNLDSSYPQVLRDLIVSLPEAGTLYVHNNLFSDPDSQLWSGSQGILIEADSELDNKYSEDPNLSADYHLLTGDSPARDNGDNNAPGRPDFDFEGDIRPSNSGDPVDIGADEYTPPQPKISVSPTTLDFPDIVVMQTSSPLDVIISNIGEVALSVTSISLNDTTNFSLDPGTCGISIAASGSCTFSVTFNPQTVGPFNASVTINSTDPDSPSELIPLSGNGDADTDGDGIGNKADPDDDNDGLPDEVEENILGTDPLQIDTDGNGTPDGNEDPDGDGFTNIQELQCESDPGDPNSTCSMFLPFLMLLLD